MNKILRKIERKLTRWLLNREYKIYCEEHKCSACRMNRKSKGIVICSYALVLNSLEDKDE